MHFLVATHDVLEGDPTGRAILESAKCLSRLGHTVTVLAPAASAAPPIPGVRSVTVPNVSGIRRQEAAVAFYAARQILRQRPDRALVHLTEDSRLLPAVLLAAQVRLFFQVDRALGLDPASLLRSALLRGRLSTFLRLAERVIVPTEAIQEVMKHQLSVQRLSLIPRGLDLAAWPRSDRLVARAALGLPPEPRLLLLIDTLDSGLELRWVAEAHRQVAGLLLLVVGEGDADGFVEAMALSARPSSPVVHWRTRDQGLIRSAVAAADFGLCARPMSGSRDPPLWFGALGRRQIALCKGPTFDALDRAYSPEEVVYYAEEKSAAHLRDALRRAVDEERRRGPIPEAAIELARGRLSLAHRAERIADLVSS